MLFPYRRFANAVWAKSRPTRCRAGALYWTTWERTLGARSSRFFSAHSSDDPHVRLLCRAMVGRLAASSGTIFAVAMTILVLTKPGTRPTGWATSVWLSG